MNLLAYCSLEEQLHVVVEEAAGEPLFSVYALFCIFSRACRHAARL
jgi:hypothetical protein